MSTTADARLGPTSDSGAKADDGPPATDVETMPRTGAPAAGLTGRSHRGLVWTLVAAAAVVVALATVVVHVRLANTRTSLTAAHVELRRTIEHLDATRRSLSVVEDQSSTAGQALAAAAIRLSNDQAALARADASVFVNGIDIADLNSCLSGVERALNQLGVGDSGGAVTTLGSVSVPCQRVERSAS